MNRSKKRASRAAYFAASALFTLFLVYSAPHLVHHAFDHAGPTPCPVLSFAKGCYLKPFSGIHLPQTRAATHEVVLSPEVWIPYLTPSPFSKRAPPIV